MIIHYKQFIIYFLVLTMYKSIVLAVCLFFVTSAQGRSPRRLKHMRTHQILPANKIFGGNDTDIIDVPYQVQVGFLQIFVCSGSILSENFVLTGADCTTWFETGEMNVRYGASKIKEGGTIIPVKEIFVHPLYDEFGYDYDIGILQLEKPIKFSKTAKPIALASKEAVAGDKGLISGWGYLEKNGDLSSQLQSTVVTAISRDQCNKVYFDYITERMICTADAGKGGCYGDHGAPFVINGTQSGIISFTFGDCGDVMFPYVYTNVANLRSFIDESTGGEAQWV